MQFLKFAPRAFFENLSVMGKGMLGIFIVTAVIVTIVNALNSIPDKKDKN